MLVFLLTLCMAIGTNSSGERGPKNLVILAGKETTMSCNPGPGILGIDWYFVVVGGSEEIKLSSKSQIFTAAKDYSVSGKIPGQSLSINSTEIKHAGKYICTTLMPQENRSRAADVVRFSAQVIVLESDPVCHLNTSTTMEPDIIEMWCVVRYSGNWVPVMEWKEINGNVIKNGILTESTNNSLTSTLNVSADASKHNSSYLCLIYFTAPQNQTSKYNIADNISDYNFTWTSPLLRVLYGPKEASLSPHKESYSEGDEVVCLAEANPSPRFEWKILENNETFDGPVLVIRSEMIRADSISIQCTAINDATAFQAKSFIVKIRATDSKPVSQVTIIVAVVATAVLMFLIATIIIVLPGVQSRRRAATETKTEACKEYSELPAALIDAQTYDSLHFESMEDIAIATVYSGERSTVADVNLELNTEQPMKDDPSFEYATMIQMQTLANVLCKSGGENSNSVSTTSSSSEPNEVLSEYTGMGHREPPKSSAYTAIVRQLLQVSESKSSVATTLVPVHESYAQDSKQQIPLHSQPEHALAKLESPLPSAAIINLIEKNQQRAIAIALKMKNDATC